jgi:hypothetical protein
VGEGGPLGRDNLPQMIKEIASLSKTCVISHLKVKSKYLMQRDIMKSQRETTTYSQFFPNQESRIRSRIEKKTTLIVFLLIVNRQKNKKLRL